MSAVPIYASNDWVHKIRLYEVLDGAITKTPATTGSASGFIAIASNGTIAHPSLVITAVHVEDGWWRISIDDSLLDPTVLDALATTTLYAIIVHSGGIKAYVELEYFPQGRAAEVA